jgi:ubiquinone/menaquinone biosynthesis C-methylase UbiE
MFRRNFSLSLVVIALGLTVQAQPGPAPRRVEPQKLAPFVTSPQPVIDQMLSMAGVRRDETVFDLGCGDGRILVAAAKQFGAKAVGVEMSDVLVKRALGQAQAAGVSDRVQVIKGDLRDVDVSQANVVTLYLMTEANDMLRPKLEKELKPGTRVVSLDFKFRNWKPSRVERVENQRHNYTIYLYEMPQK